MTPQDGEKERDKEREKRYEQGGTAVPHPPIGDEGSFSAWAAARLMDIERALTEFKMQLRGVEESQRSLSSRQLAGDRKTRKLDGKMVQLEGKVDHVMRVQDEMSMIVGATKASIDGLVVTIQPMVESHTRIDTFFDEQEDKKKIDTALHEQSEAHARAAAESAKRVADEERAERVERKARDEDERAERKAREESVIRRGSILATIVGLIIASANVPDAIKTWGGQGQDMAAYAQGHAPVVAVGLVAVAALVTALWRGRRRGHRRIDDLALDAARRRLALEGAAGSPSAAGGAHEGKGGQGGAGQQSQERPHA